MHDSVDVLALDIEDAVELMLAGGLALAVDDLAVRHVDDDDVLRLSLKIVQSAGADDHEALLAVADADVAAGALGQAVGDQFFAVFYYEFSFFLHQHGGILLHLFIVVSPYRHTAWVRRQSSA